MNILTLYAYEFSLLKHISSINSNCK